MAEAVVSFFLGKLSELLQEEANLFGGVDGEIRLLRDELEWVSSFLKDADGKRKENERVAIWVGQIRDIAFTAEDIIDEYVLKIERQRRRNIGFTGFIRRFLGCTNQLITLHELGNEIEAIKRRVQGISANKSKYGVEDVQLQVGESSTSASVSQLPKEKRLPIAEESEVVGFEDDQKTLVRQLIEGDKRRVTVSIVGMGGLGKTTLARKVYNSNDVLRHFECRAWVYVSQEYGPRDLLLALVESFKLPTKKEDEEEELKKKLCDYLKERRYLIVIDDIWRKQAWDSLEAGFPDGTQGSRVMLTTRNENVAWHADKQSPPHKLRLLREDECWELFCKKAFPRNDGYSCPSDLEKFGKEIVTKCSGLALAVVVLGGLLSRKPETPMAWEKVVKSLRRRLRDDENQISRILGLSYNDLPYYLKSCFLYLGVFPEDMEISARKLIQLWVAEGFVQQEESEDETLEDVAEEHLEELIHRSMIQVASKDWRGRVETCRIHDLLRDLSIEEAKEDKFLAVIGNVDAPVRARRLATLLDIGTCNSLNLSTPHIHSLLFFKSEHFSLKRQLKRLCGCFKLLRVLDLQTKLTVILITIPEEIGDLIHLRFLAFGCIRSVPSSIYNLYNLQTLRAMFSGKQVMLKSGIWKLQHLRHLDVPWLTCIEPPGAHEPSNNLQTLSYIKVGSWTDEVLMKSTNLRILRIFGDLYKHQNALKFSHHIHLDELFLNGELQKLPQLDEFPPNLTKLELHGTELSHDQWATLEALPNLQILSLAGDCFTEEKMVFSTGGFCRLLELVLSSMMRLQEWKVEQGAMPKLKRLQIKQCEKLKEVPEGLLHLTSLQELRLGPLMSWGLMDRVREVPEGEDWYKIRHIPSLIIKGR